MAESLNAIPAPELVRGPGLAGLGGIVRYDCPLACGWHHDENPGRDAAAEPMSITLPANWTTDDLSAAISAHADRRQRAYLARVEKAITDHWADAHPETSLPTAAARPAPGSHPTKESM